MVVWPALRAVTTVVVGVALGLGLASLSERLLGWEFDDRRRLVRTLVGILVAIVGVNYVLGGYGGTYPLEGVVSEALVRALLLVIGVTGVFVTYVVSRHG